MERKRSSRRYIPREKTCFAKFKDYFRQFIAFMFSNVGIIGLVVGYTIAGAFVFQAIEDKEGTKGNIEMLRIRNETVARLWNYTHTLNVFEESEMRWTNSVATELLKYQREVVAAVADGFDGSDNVERSHQWSLTAAFLYSLTVITTIGYGNLTPRTELGKVVTIFYAIAGMPLFLLYLSNIGDILARSFKWLYARCCLCKCCPKKPKKPHLGVASALKTITPLSQEPYPRGSAKLQRGNSDRGPASRQALGVNRLQGSLSMEDGVNIERGRRDLDGFGRRFKDGYGRNDEDVDDEFNERNYGIHGDDFDDDMYSSQDVHLNRGHSKMVPNVYEKNAGGFNRASSTGDVRASGYETGRSQRNSGGVDTPGHMYGDTNPRTARGGGAEAPRRGLTRQRSVFETSEREFANVLARPERGGSERLRRDTEKDSGMSKAELVLGMNDLGLEYLDLPKKKNPLQRVFGKTEVRPNRTEDLGMTQLGMRDTSRFDGFGQRGSGGGERGFYPAETSSGRGEPGWRTGGAAGRMPAPVPVPRQVDEATSDEESDSEGSGATEGSGEVEFDSQTVTVPVTICLTIMVGYICGGAVLFSSWEDWNFLDGSYFCFISLSTIGFGDFVPGDKIIYANKGFDLSFIFCSMYLMLGMALIAMCFNLMQEEVVHKMRSCMASLRNCLGCVKRTVLPSR